MARPIGVCNARRWRLSAAGVGSLRASIKRSARCEVIETIPVATSSTRNAPISKWRRRAIFATKGQDLRKRETVDVTETTRHSDGGPVEEKPAGTSRKARKRTRKMACIGCVYSVIVTRTLEQLVATLFRDPDRRSNRPAQNKRYWAELSRNVMAKKFVLRLAFHLQGDRRRNRSNG